MYRGEFYGVYAIVNDVSGKAYVGSAVKVLQRLAIHRKSLDYGSHHCAYLQRAWDKYGEDEFSFVLLQRVARLECLSDREEDWFDFFDQGGGVYNTAVLIDNVVGVKMPPVSTAVRERRREYMMGNQNLLGHKHSRESRRKMSLAHVGNQVMVGRKLSEETKARIGRSLKGNRNVRGKSWTVSESGRRNLGKNLAKARAALKKLIERGKTRQC